MQIRLDIDTAVGSLQINAADYESIGKIADFLKGYATRPGEVFFWQDDAGRRFEAPYADIDRIDLQVTA